MKWNAIKETVNSDATKEAVKKMKPSALFLTIMVLGVPVIIRYFFNDVTGYSIMVWIWFGFTILSFGIGAFAYYIDVVADIKLKEKTYLN